MSLEKQENIRDKKRRSPGKGLLLWGMEILERYSLFDKVRFVPKLSWEYMQNPRLQL